MVYVASKKQTYIYNIIHQVDCDWAYWYLPDSNTIRPARVTISSSSRGRERRVLRSNDRKQEADKDDGEFVISKVDIKPWRKFMKKSSAEPLNGEGEKEPDIKKPEKQWRVNMKKSFNKVEVEVVSKGSSVPNKIVTEKPWRTNMGKSSEKIDCEEVPKKVPAQDERPWRTGMKKQEPPKDHPADPITKKKHYDRNEVKKFMKYKRQKEKEEKEGKERQQEIRKINIQGRLNELEKLSKQITKPALSSSDPSDPKTLVQDPKKLSAEGQELLRQKLIELTEEMKKQWKSRRDTNSQELTPDKSLTLVEEIYRKPDNRGERVENNVNLVSEPLDSSRKVSNKESLRVTTRVEEKLSLCESLPPRPRSSLSDISDATEIRSLSHKSDKSLMSDKLESSERSRNKDDYQNEKETKVSMRRKETLDDVFQCLSEKLGHSERDKGQEMEARGNLDYPSENNISATMYQKPTPPGRKKYIQQRQERDTPDAINWSQRLSNAGDESSTIRNNLTTPLTDEVPEKDLSDEGQRLKAASTLGTREVYQRHQEELRKIRASVQAMDLDTPPPLLEPFSPRYPSLLTGVAPGVPLLEPQSNKTVNIPEPLPVPRPQSDGTGQESDGPPVWIDVTRDQESEADVNIATRFTQAPQGDPFNFISTVTRKYEVAPELEVSEGKLTPSPSSQDSSAASSCYQGVVDPRTYSKEPSLPQHRGRGRGTVSEQVTLETDSESTLRGIEESMAQDTPRSHRNFTPDRERRRKSRRNSKESKSSSRSQGSSGSRSRQTSAAIGPETQAPEATSSALVFSSSAAAGPPQPLQVHPSSVPSALHLRFLTELHQLEAVNNTHQLLSELEQVKKSTFEQHRGLEEVQGEVVRQRRKLDAQAGEGRLATAHQELQELYSSKLAALLQSQSEATRVTSEVAQHLAAVAQGLQGGGQGPVVRQLQELVEQLQRQVEGAGKAGSVISQASVGSSGPSEKTVDTTRQSSQSSRKEFNQDSSSKDSINGQVSIIGKNSTNGSRSSSSIQVDPMSFASKTPSSILEILDHNQAVGSTIQKTISEALASISEGDHTRSNVTAEVEEELSTDYSSQFEDESTLKEQSLKALRPCESQRRKSVKVLETRRPRLRRDFSTDGSESSPHFSEIEDEQIGNPESSLFSETDSFTRFTLEMVSQYMLEEKVRAQHKASLLRIKEKALIQEAKKKVEDLEKVKRDMVDKGKDDRMPSIKKKQRSILHKLKERRLEIAKMRENLQMAERQRKFILKEQRSLIGRTEMGAERVLDTTQTSNAESEAQESDAAEDNTAKLAVLKGLKRLDKNRKSMTSKERKFVEKKDMSGIFDTSRQEESGSDATLDRESVKTATLARQTSTASEAETEKGASPPTSIATMLPSSGARLRHSSAESEPTSLEGTFTDHSDIEARIGALR